MNVPMPYMPPTYRRLGCPGVPPPRVPEPLQWPLPLLLEKFAEYRDQLVQEVADLVRAETGIVTSVNGYTGAVTLTKSDVGLGNVVNTGDSDTPAENGAEKFTTGGAFTALARKAEKSEMSVTPGTGADADKATIQLKSGTSATVLVSHQSLASCVTGGSYDSTSKKILLKHGSTTLAEIDATAFIKDGMVSSVAIVNVPSDETPAGLSNGDYLKVTFNTDAGAGPIYIPLADIFNPSNYYDKTSADGRFVAKETGKRLMTDAEGMKLDGVAAGAQANVIETVKVNGTALTPTGKAVDIPALTQAQAVSASVAEVTAVTPAVYGDWVWPAEITIDGYVYPYAADFASVSRLPPSQVHYYYVDGFSYEPGLSAWEGRIYEVFYWDDGEPPQWMDATLADILVLGDGQETELEISVGGASVTVRKEVVAPEHNKHGLARLVDLPAASTATPQMDGTASAGSSAAFARGDHVHPKDTSKQDAIADLAAIRSGAAAGATAVQPAALAGAVRYDLGTATVISAASTDTSVTPNIDYGTATLTDRTANLVAVRVALDELRLTFPAAVSDKVRDFGLRVTVDNSEGSAAIDDIALPEPTPTGTETLTFVTSDGAMPKIAGAAAGETATTILYFSEVSPSMFLVKGEEVKEVA